MSGRIVRACYLLRYASAGGFDPCLKTRRAERYEVDPKSSKSVQKNPKPSINVVKSLKQTARVARARSVGEIRVSVGRLAREADGWSYI
jgi:hypothetical protein